MKKKIIVSTLFVATIICSLIGFLSLILTNNTLVNANNEITLNTTEIKDEYMLGDIVEFPSNIEIEYNGQTYSAKNGVIIYPSGQAMIISKHSLNEIGQYTVKYFFDLGNGSVVGVKNFKVLSSYFNLTKEDGSTINFPEDKPITFNGKDGIRVTIKDGNEFIFNQPLNLKKNKGELSSIINITPVMGNHSIETVVKDGKTSYVNYYSAYAKYVIVKLTDCYDSNKFVEIMYHYDSYYGYLRAKTNSQTDVGIGTVGKPHDKINRVANQKNVYQDGLLSSIWIGEYGTGIMSVATSKSSSGVQVFYDNELNRVYLKTKDTTKLVADLMNEEIYGNNIFDGFTTGEVYLSMRAEEFVQDSVSIDIHSIGEYSAQEIIELKDKVYADNIKPIINVDVKATDEYGVYAAIGDTVSIPNATAQDVNALGDISVKVYRNYGDSDNIIKVAVNNNTFKIDSPDVYTIEYSQKDSYGNVSIETLNVYPKYTEGDKKSIWINLKNSFDDITMCAGKKVILPEFTVDSLNIVEDAKVKIIAESVDATYVIDSANRSFIPETSGEYVFTFILEDNFGFNKIQYKKNCEIAKDAVCFKEIPVMPKYFIKGQTYNIGDIFAYEYSSGKPVKVSANTFVIMDGGAKNKIEDTSKIQITASNTVQFVYEYGQSQYITDQVKVIDVSYSDNAKNGIDVFKYFVSDDIYYDDMQENKSGKLERVSNANFIAKNGLSKAKIDFANAISMENLTIKYKVPVGYGDYDAVRFVLTGVLDSSEKAVIEIKKEFNKKTVNGVEEYEEVNNVYVNDKFAFSLTRNFSENRVKTISYNNSSSKFSVESKSILENIKITGSMCYLTIEMVGIKGAAGVEISQINNQILNGKTFNDTSVPEVSCDSAQGEYKLGSIVDISVPLFSDVLSQIDYSSIKLKIYTRSGGIVKATDGTILSDGNADPLKSYKLVLDEQATYYVDYLVKDITGKSTTYNYMMYVVDTDAPVIELLGKIQQDDVITLKAGKTLSVEYEVSDNISSQENIKHYVHLYVDDTSKFIQNVGKSFVIKETGNYTVKILARDEAGNMSVCSFKVIVE